MKNKSNQYYTILNRFEFTARICGSTFSAYKIKMIKKYETQNLFNVQSANRFTLLNRLRLYQGAVIFLPAPKTF